jgi:hypothetical protein
VGQVRARSKKSQQACRAFAVKGLGSAVITGRDHPARRSATTAALDEQAKVQRELGLQAIVQKPYSTFLERLNVLARMPHDAPKN